MTDYNYQLTMRAGPTPGTTYSLEQEESIVGRDVANEIAISDPELSRRHARFYMREGNIIVEDLGSTNGTFLNGERIVSPQQLRPGDVITFGESLVFVFERTSYDMGSQVGSQAPGAFDQPPYPQQDPEAYQPVQESSVYEQQEYYQEQPEEHGLQEPAPKGRKKQGGIPTWLIILLIAIVVFICVIAVTLWFMPASWWCAIDIFGMIEACPLP